MCTFTEFGSSSLQRLFGGLAWPLCAHTLLPNAFLLQVCLQAQTWVKRFHGDTKPCIERIIEAQDRLVDESSQL